METTRKITIKEVDGCYYAPGAWGKDTFLSALPRNREYRPRSFAVGWWRVTPQKDVIKAEPGSRGAFEATLIFEI